MTIDLWSIYLGGCYCITFDFLNCEMMLVVPLTYEECWSSECRTKLSCGRVEFSGLCGYPFKELIDIPILSCVTIGVHESNMSLSSPCNLLSYDGKELSVPSNSERISISR